MLERPLQDQGRALPLATSRTLPHRLAADVLGNLLTLEEAASQVLCHQHLRRQGSRFNGDALPRKANSTHGERRATVAKHEWLLR